MNQQFDAPVRAQPLVVQAVQPAQALNALGISASDRANIDRNAISQQSANILQQQGIAPPPAQDIRSGNAGPYREQR